MKTLEKMTMEFKKTFASDNTSGVHPQIMEAIASVNSGHFQSYGLDPLTEKMNQLFKDTFNKETNAYLVFNGTAANVLSQAPLIKSFEGIICSDTAHLALDECSAPEKWLGAKLFLTPHRNGKIYPEDIEKHLIRKGDQHYSQPRVISITQPTEYGTVYSKQEIKDIVSLAKKHGLYVHMDGARVANAAHYLKCDLRDITCDLGVDVLSFGGTKNGLLNVEAVVFFNSKLSENFKFYRKQGLQLSSKHRFQSIQFITYLENNLWKNIAQHTHSLAKRLESGVKDLSGIEIVAPVESNAVFARLPKNVIHPLKKRFFFYVWDENDTVVRWMCTFDHTEKDIDDFISAIRECL